MRIQVNAVILVSFYILLAPQHEISSGHEVFSKSSLSFIPHLNLGMMGKTFALLILDKDLFLGNMQIMTGCGPNHSSPL